MSRPPSKSGFVGVVALHRGKGRHQEGVIRVRSSMERSPLDSKGVKHRYILHILRRVKSICMLHFTLSMERY